MTHKRWLANLAALSLLLSTVLPASSAKAGHTIVGGDCWKAGTPLICRNTWVDNQFLRVRLIDEMNNADLHGQADVARANWTAAAGPQILSFGVQANDTWIYLKRNDGMVVQSGVTFNCNANLVPVCSNQAREMMIVWSEIFVPLGNKDHLRTSTTIFAHEIGHGLGLFHHGNACVPLMSTGVIAVGCANPPKGPQATDIGGLPACGAGVQPGIRCIYKWD